MHPFTLEQMGNQHGRDLRARGAQKALVASYESARGGNSHLSIAPRRPPAFAGCAARAGAGAVAGPASQRLECSQSWQQRGHRSGGERVLERCGAAPM